MKRGIDISKHQGSVNFDEIKRDYDFVIIRVAIGDDLSEDNSQCSQCDDMAQQYINECEDRKIPYALYIYSYALDISNALSEAEHIREWFDKCNAKLGVWWDIEDADYYKQNHGLDYNDTQQFAIAWLDALSDIPIKGIYASHSWFTEYMNVDELKEHGAAIWEAHWNDDGEICDERFDISQESSDYHLDDGTRIDFDIMRDEFYNKCVWGNQNNPEQQIDFNCTWSKEQAEPVVDAMYNGLLHRSYDGVNTEFVNNLMHDWTRVQAFDAIRDSDEYKKKRLIIDCYLCMRGTAPSSEELDDWMQVGSYADIKNGILYSDEFNSKYGV